MTPKERLGEWARRLDRSLFAANLNIYRTRFKQELGEGWESLLDVGCGNVSSIDDLCATIPKTVGIDAYAPTITQRLTDGPYRNYLQLDALHALETFGPRSFDVVIAMDVIEHFPKDEGYRLLDVVEAVARHRVIVFTPNGLLRQGELGGNPYQVHLSGWRPEEFSDRGYRVAGLHGLRPLRGECWEPRIKPTQLGHRISAATQPLVTRRPWLAYQLLATLDIPGPAQVA